MPKLIKPDPRRIGYWRISQHGRSIQSTVFSGVRAALILCAFALPFLYVGTMVLRRQWSLSFFLLAPLVLMLFLLAIRTSWFGVMTLLEGYAWLATPIGLWWAIQPPMNTAGFPKKAKWPFLAVLVVIAFVALVAKEYSAKDELLDCPIGVRDVVFTAVCTISYALKYWFGFVFFATLFFEGGLYQRLAGSRCE